MMSYSPNGVDPNSSYQGLSEDAERVFWRGWLQPAISVALRYGLALVSVSVAFVLAQTFLYYGLPQPFTAFALSAIAGTFWYGGTKPGILVALISWLVRDYFFESEVGAESRILTSMNSPDSRQEPAVASLRVKSSGVGMGLSICRSIIDAHGGRLWADANEPRGAVFQFTLPSAEGELCKSIELPEKGGLA